MTTPSRSTSQSMDAHEVLTVSGDRLLETLTGFATYGATPAGGLNRLALSDADTWARDELCEQSRLAGYQVRVDAVGNIFITRPGLDHGSTVLMGSHLDSQPFGGRFDGTYGVLAGLEVLRALDDAAVTTARDITLVDWTNEEGARFSPSVLGSSVFAGVMPLAQALARTDAEGKTLGDELERAGYAGDFDSTELSIHQAFEAHIEQGPVLEETGTDIGVVTGIQGLRWFDITVRGESRHAGTTPRNRRKDALAGAAQIIDWTDRLPDLINDAAIRATIGELRVHPNSRNVIPGATELFADFRHPEAATLERVARLLEAQADRVRVERGLSVELEQVLDVAPTRFPEEVVGRVRAATESLGLSHRDIASGAGHDSMNIARLAPTGMLFIPCVNGLSHTEAEDIRPQWAINGANVLLNAVLASANEPEASDE